MAKWFVEIFFFFCSFFVLGSWAADTLYPNQSIKTGETIVSADGVFELGFFSPGGSKNRYLSIRYKKASAIIAWVANRDAPLTDASGMLNLSSQGTLQILDGSNNKIWSTNSSRSLKNPVAQLLNTGNLVIRSHDDPDSGFYLWQSFDYPDNTLIPGMKIGKNLADGIVWSFNSWKSTDDPSPGNFQVRLDITGYPQLLLYNGSSIQIRIGPWNGARFSGIPSSGPNNIFRDEFAIKADEIYYKYDLVDNSVLIRTTVEPDGRVIRYTSTGQSNTWQATIFLQPDYCDDYARCGANGICSVNTLCRCLDGFKPKNAHAWSILNFSEGCVQESQLNCSIRDEFVSRLNMKWPDTRNSSYDLSMNLEDCKKKCLKNCSCRAYAYVNSTEKGSGCLFWFGALIDIRDQEQSGLGFYVRVAASASGSSSSSRARQIALFVLVPVVSFLTVILAFYLRSVCKYRKKCRKGEMIENEIDKGKEDLPLFDFKTIANATNNFSNGNKLGQGGFGPVYKGILEDGQEVAVKRRSTCSTQGVEEFGNEVSCIAKLQHRNLVRLLGWSTTEEGERLLVYEYMPNKSLDYFIFGADIKQRALLDWPKRYKIINGIAKGLLYLHEDSRLRVIHRDLKASNILLDFNMNPKISDFGMARSFGDGETEANTARVVGTYGYMAPEYAVEGAFSVKSDVYSFGVLVIEILSGKKSRFFNHPGHNLNLIGHAWTSYNEDRLSELIDVSILKTSDRCEAFRAIQIGLLCVQQYPEDRPNMSSVLMMLTSKGDILSANQTIKNGETIVSAGGVYELGFFGLGSSTNQYLSIRYKKAGGVIAWIANRDAPLTNASGALTLSSEGTLKLSDGTNTIIWSSNSTKSSKNPVAKLLDTGNLVIRTDNDADQGDFLWQSFDFPDNAFLPSMKIGSQIRKNLANGLVWSFNSWKSNDDPSPGTFSVKLDITGYPQLIVYNGSARYIRVGPWNGITWSGIPTAGPNNIFVDEFHFEEEEIYYKYELFSNSLLIRLIIVPDGRVIRYTWTSQSNNWEPATFIQADYCDGYARCGAYGTCNLNTLCRCLDGFKPQNLEAWRGLNFSEGCVRATEYTCSNRDDFVPHSNKKLPDTQRSSYNLSMNLEDCKKKCLENCSCTAYANTNIKGNGSGCLLWFGGLVDIRDQEQSGHVFYVRVAASGSGSGSSSTASSSSGSRRIVLIVLLPIISILTVVLGFYLWHVCKYRKKDKEELVEGEIDNEGEDLPLLDFRTIANATNNFSNNNKLGEGGFGPVYKGILEDGKEIAVKRRSTCSTQGVEEFKNEVSCIAKLQHRNLVRLLGWSTTEEGERMLVYEYMPNKSLNFFIFGDKKERASLDWPKRYNIINGIAKGLLYLHEDSRLRVIHRDLKASNILLDYNMNPKISDFGMARSFGDTETEANTARVVGTYGYMSPEYAIEGAFSVKSDVYSFGVLMIEIVSGKKSRFFNHPGHNLNLMGHAWMSYKEDRLVELIDESILDSIDQNEVFRVILIGLLCVQQYPEDRPNMSSVLMMLTSNISLPHPKQPGFFTERKLDEEYNLSGNIADAFYNLLDTSSSNQTVTIVEPR